MNNETSFNVDAIFDGLTTFNFDSRFDGNEIEFAQRCGLIPSRDDAPMCHGKSMRCYNDSAYRCGFQFRCCSKVPKSKKICRKGVNPMTNTWFGANHIALKMTLQLTYWYVCGYKVTDAVREIGVTAHTAIDLFARCGEICQVIVNRDLTAKSIGGLGKTVEIEEAQLRKSSSEKILGGRCREDGQSFLVRIPNENQTIFYHSITRYIDKNSVVMTSCDIVYDTLVDFGFKVYHSVSHKKNFVDFNDRFIHTLNAKRQWREVKEAIKSYGEGCIERYLAVYQYKDKYFKEPYEQYITRNEGKANRSRREIMPNGQKFRQFLMHVKLVYPGPRKIGLQLSDYDNGTVSHEIYEPLAVMNQSMQDLQNTGEFRSDASYALASPLLECDEDSQTDMNQKRKLPDCYVSKKRICSTGVRPDTTWPEEHNDGVEDEHVPACSDTKAALLYLKNGCPMNQFDGRLPFIAFQHQLYSILKNRTLVDKEVGALRQAGEIRLFHIGAESNELCVVFTEDYRAHVCKFNADMDVPSALINRFLSVVALQCPDVSLSKQRMSELQFSDAEITQLVKACVLTVRDVGSWWVAIPAAGVFMRSFLFGRKSILGMIRKSKYQELLQKELEQRKLPKKAKLGLLYHLHDIIGADLVKCVTTTSGPLLRLT